MEEISIESVSQRFEEHLNIEGNNRIIFSGKFGTGKTYFLNKFFEDRPAVYNKFIISPANYVVSSNEDIFELIKADIIKDLFVTGKIDLKQLPKDNTAQKISSFIENNQLVLGKFLLNTVSKLSATTSIPLEIIKAISEVYKKYNSDVIKNAIEDETRSEELAKYWVGIYDKIGNIYEHNYITELINSFLEDITLKGEKKNILVIDDLDRIDPDHIFRILNVLSAHNNQFREENKFGFDHVLIVCDIDNIQKIFAHRYGQNVDFDGYMDKFYSTDIFFFSNLDAMNVYVDSMEIPISNQSVVIKKIIKIILAEFIVRNKITTRKLIKHKIHFDLNAFRLFTYPKINQENYRVRGFQFINPETSIYADSSDLGILYFLKLMSILFGNFKDFLTLLKSCLDESKDSQELVDFEDVFFYLGLQEHISEKVSEETFIKIDTYFDEYRRARVTSSIERPTLVLNGEECRMILKWTNGSPYNGSESYFNNARIILKNSNDTPRNINVKWILLQLETIIRQCYQNKYLEKVGIIY